jgi:hypothetical protein
MKKGESGGDSSRQGQGWSRGESVPGGELSRPNILELRDTSQKVVPQRLSQRQTLISFNPSGERFGVLWKKDAHRVPQDQTIP